MVRYSNLKFSKLGEIAMVTIIAMFIAGVMTAQAQRNTFTDAYLKLRQPKEGEEIVIEKLGRKKIRELLVAPEPEGQTEKEREKYLREKAMCKNTKQISLVVDTEKEGLLSFSQVNDLLRPYEELASMKTEGMKMLLNGVLKRGKIKELICVFGDTDGEGLIIANILYKKPIALQDYMDNPEDIQQLFSINSTAGEDDHALIKIKFSKNMTPITIPGYDNTTPYTLEVVQVDGKYGVQRTPEPVKDQKYLIKPTYEIEPVIYGSNPGNTYIMVFDHDYSYLYDKFGFIVAHGDELSPVYVSGNEKEVAAFIIRDYHRGYSLYECPETYALIQHGSLDIKDKALRPHKDKGFSFRPYIERRILGCQSIVQTEDDRLECVQADGSIEFIVIRKQK